MSLCLVRTTVLSKACVSTTRVCVIPGILGSIVLHRCVRTSAPAMAIATLVDASAKRCGLGRTVRNMTARTIAEGVECARTTGHACVGRGTPVLGVMSNSASTTAVETATVSEANVSATLGGRRQTVQFGRVCKSAVPTGVHVSTERAAATTNTTAQRVTYCGVRMTAWEMVNATTAFARALRVLLDRTAIPLLVPTNARGMGSVTRRQKGWGHATAKRPGKVQSVTNYHARVDVVIREVSVATAHVFVRMVGPAVLATNVHVHGTALATEIVIRRLGSARVTRWNQAIDGSCLTALRDRVCTTATRWDAAFHRARVSVSRGGKERDVN